MKFQLITSTMEKIFETDNETEAYGEAELRAWGGCKLFLFVEGESEPCYEVGDDLFDNDTLGEAQ